MIGRWARLLVARARTWATRHCPEPVRARGRLLEARVERLPPPVKRAAKLALAVGLVFAGGWVLRELLTAQELPSEITTGQLVGLIVGLVLVGCVVIQLVRCLVDRSEHLLALTGLNLLVIGTVVAISILPDSGASTPTVGAMGVLPPFLAQQNRGFVVGLVARPQGCQGSVPLTIVANGSQEYWAEHESGPPERLSLVMVLPGRYGKLTVGLGAPSFKTADDPLLAVIDSSAPAKRELQVLKVLRPGEVGDPREQTIVTVLVRRWAETHRPLIIETSAHWITHHGLSDCRLQLPRLAGASSAQALASAFDCSELNDRFGRGVCADPPARGGAAQSLDVSPALEVSRASTTVIGSALSAPESSPQPTMQKEQVARWSCGSTWTRTPLRVAAGAQTSETGETGETAEADDGGGGDCHATAIVLSSTWQHDFLLALIGGFVAVGVHLVFQARSEKPDPEDDAAV
jgi:hypothetical protein